MMIEPKFFNSESITKEDISALSCSFLSSRMGHILYLLEIYCKLGRQTVLIAIYAHRIGGDHTRAMNMQPYNL